MFVTSQEITTHGAKTHVVTTKCFTKYYVPSQVIIIQPSKYGCQNSVSQCMRHNPGCDNTGVSTQDITTSGVTEQGVTTHIVTIRLSQYRVTKYRELKYTMSQYWVSQYRC